MGIFNSLRRLVSRSSSPVTDSPSIPHTFKSPSAQSLIPFLPWPLKSGMMSQVEAVSSSGGTREEKSARLAELFSSWEVGKPHWRDWNEDDAIQLGYKTNTWVFACLFRWLNSAARVPWVVEEGEGEDWQPARNHPLSMLIKNPNPQWSTGELISWLILHLHLGGETLWSMLKVRGRVTEIWAISPRRFRVIPDDDMTIRGYQLYRDGKPHGVIKPNDAVWFAFPDPEKPFRGQSTLQAASRSIDTDNEAQDFQKIGFENRGVPSGLVLYDHDLDPVQHERAVTRVNEHLSGKENSRRIGVMGNRASWAQLSMTPAEMDFLQSRAASRLEICAAFGVPLPMVGDYGNATLANLETSRTILWLDTILPFLDMVRDIMNGPRGLTRHFGTGIRLNYDVSGVHALRPVLAKSVDIGQKWFTMGYPVNTINRRLGWGMPPIPGGDVGWVPSTLQPASMQSLDPNADLDLQLANEPDPPVSLVEDDETDDRVAA